jgi:hypothetical protein
MIWLVEQIWARQRLQRRSEVCDGRYASAPDEEVDTAEWVLVVEGVDERRRNGIVGRMKVGNVVARVFRIGIVIVRIDG